MGMTATAEQTGLIGVGYEGRDLASFVADLLAAGVSRLVDVRLTPISRKPGFSKSSLLAALADAGIEYEHRRELGNPKPNRAGFAGNGTELAHARAVYAALLRQPGAVQALDEMASASEHERVAVLCFEAEQQRCHRHVVLHEIARRWGSTGSGSTRRAR